MCCLATLINCRPQNDKLDIQETDDEFVFKKPDNTDSKYTDFLDELYKHDTEKKSATSTKTKRDLGSQDDKIFFDDPNLFDKNENTHPTMEKIVSHLYQSDEFKRSKRMILFRYFLQ